MGERVMRCACGYKTASVQKISEHRKRCKRLKGYLQKEYDRLSEKYGTHRVKQGDWNREAAKSLPRSISLLRRYPSRHWAYFQAEMTGGTVAIGGNGKPQYMPPAPKHWDLLLPNGELVSPFVPEENIINLLLGMIHEAHSEANGEIAYHTNENRNESDSWGQAIIDDARAWIAELQEHFAEHSAVGRGAKRGRLSWEYEV